MKAKIARYIEDTIPTFHQRRLESLGGLRLKSVLRRKNPYLFKAKAAMSLPGMDDEFVE